MAWYNTGNIALTNGSATVTGSGTNFLVGAQIGEALYAPDGKLYEIQTINSATVITLASNYLGSTASGQDYQIIPTQSLVADLASDVTDLISDFADVRDYAGNGKFNDGAVGTPGITFTQDQDNGLYRIGSNNWALAAGGQQVVNLTTTAMNFPDNNKAIFGAGSDLQIYSDGTTGQVTGNVNVTGSVTADGLTVDTDTLVVDATNNRVGIGTSSPSEPLTVLSEQDYQITAAYNASNSTSYGYYGIKNNNTGNPFYFHVGGAERIRIDASGNTLLGNTIANPASGFSAQKGFGYAFATGKVEIATTANDAVMELGKNNANDGSILVFRKQGNVVGSIGTNSGFPYFAAPANFSIMLATTDIRPRTVSGASNNDASVDLGTSDSRFKDIYRSGSTFSTSDRTMKQDIRDLTDAERNVAVACKGLLKAFRFIHTVEKEGDAANIHFGIMAQDLAATFAAEGLDANDYQVYKSIVTTDEDGNEQTRLNVCYENLLAFIIAAI